MEEAALPRDPSFLAFLPILCAVWADGMLDDDEIGAVKRAVSGAGWMSPEGRAHALRWLDRERPPPAHLFGEAVALVRARAGVGVTLAGAGAALAGGATRSEVLAALARVEMELGLSAAEALGELARMAGGGAWSVEEGAGPEAAPVRPAPERGGAGALGSTVVVASQAGAHPAAPSLDRAPERVAARAVRRVAAAIARVVAGDHPQVRAQVRAALARPELAVPEEVPRGEHRERTLAAVRVLAKMGLGALAFPRDFGGTGDPRAAVAAFEELALGDLGVLVKFGVQFGLFGGSIAQLGTAKHHRRYLHRVASLELPGCYAMTETGHGSNVRDLRTTADHDPATGEFVICTPDRDAQKDYIGNAALHGRMATVFARLRVQGAGPSLDDQGVHAFLVPIRDEQGRAAPGVSIEDCGPKLGLNGVDNGRIRFDSVRVPADALLDRFARVTPEGRYESPIPSEGRRFFTMLGTLVSGRISIGAASLAVTRKALAIAVRYAAERRQFGPAGAPEVPILHYLSVQRALLPRLAACYATGFAVRSLVRRLAPVGAEPAPDFRQVEVRAAGLKAVASRLAIDTLQACREACGGQGYLAANQFARLKADADIFATFEGANAVLLQLAAKGLLSRFRRDLGNLDMWGMARYLAELAGTGIAELNPVATRRTDPEHLASHDTHLAALRYREGRLLRSAARRLKARLDRGVDSFAATNECQDHLIALARAHVDRIVLEAAIEALEDPGAWKPTGPAEARTADAQPHAADARPHSADARPNNADADPAPDAAGRRLLSRLVALHGLATLESHRAWYLEAGYFEPSKSQAVRGQVNALCRELAPRAVELVDAFDIPDWLLRAPIGRGSRRRGPPGARRRGVQANSPNLPTGSRVGAPDG